MTLMPTLTSLRAFDLLARCGSFTDAARRLNVTRPAISKQVKELEQALGCQLIIRSGPNVALTDMGRELAAGLQQGFDTISGATQRIADRATRPETVRILVERDFASSWLAERIGAFLVSHPGVSVEITAERNGRLRPGEDFSFRIFYGPEETVVAPDLVAETLCGWIDIPLCAPDYAAAHPVGEGRYEGVRFLLDGNYNPWDAWFEKAGLQNPGGDAAFTRFNETSLCLSAALSGAGMTIGDSFLCLHEIEAERLVAPFKLGLRSTERYIICHSAGRSLSEAEMAFVQWLRQAIATFEQSVTRVFDRKGIVVA